MAAINLESSTSCPVAPSNSASSETRAAATYVFRDRGGKLIKILWADGLGISLYAKRFERGRFLSPSLADGW
ncbi:IS66 family insertion sequence element accessory protein TnpB [Bradyrhizobium sp. DOA9]|uniref:IS66 family insertion sequence element accessory protein TnpB n=1 Tax=Bradyrhizobium sp. DOA9 TaxID=1126627 RepID=UPI0009EEE741|nr:IS66 family insertion sequence element accessory protein TnpB [Bradyrhizobium sp. DOA9]